MKRFLLACAFTCAVSVTALAGSIPTSDAPVPQGSAPLVTIILTVLDLVK